MKVGAFAAAHILSYTETLWCGPPYTCFSRSPHVVDGALSMCAQCVRSVMWLT